MPCISLSYVDLVCMLGKYDGFLSAIPNKFKMAWKLNFTFYSTLQCLHCKRCTSYGIYVCLSVRLTHAGIVSKRRHVAWCTLHSQIAKCV